MNKKELIAQMAENAGLSKKDAAAALEAFQNAVIACMAAQDKIVLPGFGIFEARIRDARVGRNPHTGEQIEISAHPIVRFKTGSNLKNACK